jgi:hypothetical protein
MSRMFIVAKYPQSLKDGKQNNWQNNEEVRCVKNLKTRDLTEASVVLDVANEKVIKNRFNENTDFGELYKYYLSHYADYINKWVNTQRHG